MRISDWSSDVCSSDLPATYSYVYLSSNPLKIGFQPYDPDAPPNDVANTTTDQGVTVPFIVRVETGYQDRDQYKIAVLLQPGTDWSAVQHPAQLHHKRLYQTRFWCGVLYQLGTALLGRSHAVGNAS